MKTITLRKIWENGQTEETAIEADLGSQAEFEAAVDAAVGFFAASPEAGILIFPPEGADGEDFIEEVASILAIED